MTGHAFPRTPQRFRTRALAWACACTALMGGGSTVHALPSQGVVTQGQASIQADSANGLTITQSSNAATIQWQSFSIGVNEQVRFVQPNSQSVTLNRVLGADPSQILGRLSANGQVFLINPNGVLFGRDASVNVGGLVASTLGLSDTDFLAGRYRFAGTSTAEVRNQGDIRADSGGYVALLGTSVTNDGHISTPLGSTVLAAGSAITLDFAGDGLVRVAIDQPTWHALVSNQGVIESDGGVVWMGASARDAVFDTVLNNSGVVQAQTLAHRNGRIVLDGGSSGVVSVSGELRAAGLAPDTTGGTIVVTGDKLALTDTARLDATGSSGGGNIALGGGWQGQDPAIRAATAVYIARGAVVDASATARGNGGTIAVWSDVQNAQSSTRVYGNLRARGGASSGNGGRIETSGHWIDLTGMRLDLVAPHGQGGQWLLDPEDLTIGSAPTDATYLPPGPFALFTSGPGTPNVLNTDIESQLNAGVSVVLQTAPTGTGAGNIAINASIAKTGGGNAGLTLQAHGAITLANGISINSSSGTLDVNLLAGGSITLGSGSSIASNGGTIVLAGSSFSNAGGAGVFNVGGGQWLVYSNSPLTDTLGGLNSGNPAIWGQTPGTLAPPSVGPGNWFIYASANPVAAATQAVGTLQGSAPATVPVPTTPFADPQWVDFDPPQWLAQKLEEMTMALVPLAVPGSTAPGGFSLAPAPANAGPVAPPAAPPVAASGTTPAMAPPPATPAVTRLSSPGFAGVPRSATTTSTATASPTRPRATLDAFLKGAARSFQVGTSGSGAVLLASVDVQGKVPTLTVAVAAGDSFQLTLPPPLLQSLQTDGRLPSLQPAALPGWLRFDRAAGRLVADSVPSDGLPLTVRLLGSNGKFVQVVLQ